MATAPLAACLLLAFASVTFVPHATASASCPSPGYTGTCANDPNCPSPFGGNGTGVYVKGAWVACINSAKGPAGPTVPPGCYGVVAPRLTGVCVMDPACPDPNGSYGVGQYIDGHWQGCLYS